MFPIFIKTYKINILIFYVNFFKIIFFSQHKHYFLQALYVIIIFLLKKINEEFTVHYHFTFLTKKNQLTYYLD